MRTESNSLTTVRLGGTGASPEGGGGAWPEGRAGLLVEALGSPSCVIEELDVRGCGLDTAALVSACPTLKTLALGGKAVRDAEGAALGAALAASTSLNLSVST